MDKIRFITDTASDIPDREIHELGIEIASIPIVVDGQEFFERKSFSTTDFYDILSKASEIPVTSRVPMDTYITSYRKAWEENCTHVINVTLNAGGSGINASAQMARDFFYENAPEAKDKMKIWVVDSRSYSMVYGHPVIEGAKMARDGKSADEILAYMEDYFDRVEIYLACYTLEYAKRSGRIGAAAAFVGDVLGLRPIVSMIDGDTKTADKVRGDKNLPGRLFQMYLNARVSEDDVAFIVRGSDDGPVEELQQLFVRELGRPVPVYYCGASIAINSGPRMLAIVCTGQKRT